MPSATMFDASTVIWTADGAADQEDRLGVVAVIRWPPGLEKPDEGLNALPT